MKPALLGLGHAVPAAVRLNTDPVFDWIRAHPPQGQELFQGYLERRVLAHGEDIETHMGSASAMALDQAGVKPADVDLLLGFTSVSPYVTPNSLVLVHHALGLRADCWVMPISGEFSNFNAALWMADALLATGRARHALIVCGTNWSRHVSYRTAQCVCAGDGAGAAVLGPSASGAHWRVVDAAALFPGGGWGNMFMQGDALDVLSVQPGPAPRPVLSPPYFHITDAGLEQFKHFGMEQALQPVRQLLERHGLRPEDVTIVPHQTSQPLLEAWQQQLGAAHWAETLERFGNMVSANLPVNLSVCSRDIATDALLLLGLGPEPHATALLLRRHAPSAP